MPSSLRFAVLPALLALSCGGTDFSTAALAERGDGAAGEVDSGSSGSLGSGGALAAAGGAPGSGGDAVSAGGSRSSGGAVAAGGAGDGGRGSGGSPGTGSGGSGGEQGTGGTVPTLASCPDLVNPTWTPAPCPAVTPCHGPSGSVSTCCYQVVGTTNQKCGCPAFDTFGNKSGCQPL